MQVMRLKNRLLLGYFLIAYIFVQSISGFLHTHLHGPAQEPATAHHHYPVASTFMNTHDIAETPSEVVEVDLQLDSLFGNTIFPLILFVLLFTLLLPQATRRSIRLPATNIVTHSSQGLHYRTPPLRAPPL